MIAIICTYSYHCGIMASSRSASTRHYPPVVQRSKAAALLLDKSNTQRHKVLKVMNLFLCVSWCLGMQGNPHCEKHSDLAGSRLNSPCTRLRISRYQIPGLDCPQHSPHTIFVQDCQNTHPKPPVPEKFVVCSSLPLRTWAILRRRMLKPIDALPLLFTSRNNNTR